MVRTGCVLIFLLAILSPLCSYAAEGDVPGSSDYPAIGRFAGSLITFHDVKDFDEVVIPTGAFTGGAFQSAEQLEGKIWRIAYRHEPGPSVVEVARNFHNALTEAGFTIAFECSTKECGGGGFRYEVETINIPYMNVDTFNYRYIAAHNPDGAQPLWASILVSTNNQQIYVQVFVVQLESLELSMVPAEAMASAIATEGRVALYGIYFDSNKTEIKPASQPTLDEIGRLLNTNASLKLIVVGHTDNQGSLQHNQSLSERRAAAVAAALVADYGVDAARLQAAGVAFLAPLASNHSEEGRAKNRRVELIEQ